MLKTREHPANCSKAAHSERSKVARFAQLNRTNLLYCQRRFNFVLSMTTGSGQATLYALRAANKLRSKQPPALPVALWLSKLAGSRTGSGAHVSAKVTPTLYTTGGQSAPGATLPGDWPPAETPLGQSLWRGQDTHRGNGLKSLMGATRLQVDAIWLDEERRSRLWSSLCGSLTRR